jgi:hypothetical protein
LASDPGVADREGDIAAGDELDGEGLLPFATHPATRKAANSAPVSRLVSIRRSLGAQMSPVTLLERLESNGGRP